MEMFNSLVLKLFSKFSRFVKPDETLPSETPTRALDTRTGIQKMIESIVMAMNAFNPCFRFFKFFLLQQHFVQHSDI